MAKKTYKVRTRFTFEGEFEVNADDKEQAKEYVGKHCGFVIGGDIHTSLPDEIVPDWNFSVHGDKEIISVRKG
ncbi:MAG TPA: hypothetical protein VF411_01580 [Bacteroidia bacterium]